MLPPLLGHKNEHSAVAHAKAVRPDIFAGDGELRTMSQPPARGDSVIADESYGTNRLAKITTLPSHQGAGTVHAALGSRS